MKKENIGTAPAETESKPVAKDTADMPIEEYKRRLEEAETRARVAESDAAILRECIVRMSLERYGVLR